MDRLNNGNAYLNLLFDTPVKREPLQPLDVRAIVKAQASIPDSPDVVVLSHGANPNKREQLRVSGTYLSPDISNTEPSTSVQSPWSLSTFHHEFILLHKYTSNLCYVFHSKFQNHYNFPISLAKHLIWIPALTFMLVCQQKSGHWVSSMHKRPILSIPWRQLNQECSTPISRFDFLIRNL